MVEQAWLNEGDVIITKEQLDLFFELCDFKRAHEDEWNKWKKRQ